MKALVFAGYTLLFGLALFVCALLTSGIGNGEVIFGVIAGGAVLAGLRLLWEKLEQIDQKLDELLKKRDEHDVQ